MQSNTLLQLSTSLYCIEIPKEAEQFKNFFNKEIHFVSNGKIYAIEVPFAFELLGVMTSSTKLSFDASPYLESHINKSNNQRCFKDYQYNYDKTPIVVGQYFINPKNSLLSLLTSHHLHWTNPMGEKPADITENTEIAYTEEGNVFYPTLELLEEWQHLEDTILKGQLLFLTNK